MMLGDRLLGFWNHFHDLEDPRHRAKVLYPLDKILLLCLPGVFAGCECWAGIAKFGRKKLSLIRRFRPFQGWNARARMTGWAIFLQPLTPGCFSGVPSPGWHNQRQRESPRLCP